MWVCCHMERNSQELLALAIGSLLKAEREKNGGGNVPLSFGPPPYQLMLMILARLVHGDPHVYADIQALNNNAVTVRTELRSALAQLDGSYEDVTNLIKSLDTLQSALSEVDKSCHALFQAPLLSIEKSNP